MKQEVDRIVRHCPVMSKFYVAVVVSLWSVDDKATAELMSRFYRGMLQKGLPPAAALRAAQVEMWQIPQWKASYYWAGFVIQGEWK